MRVLRSLEDAEKYCSNAVIAVGNFDGVHRGHEAILEHLIVRSGELSAPNMVVTFEPHPQLLIGRKPPLPILTPTVRKLELLSRYAINAILLIPFTKEFSKITAETFVKTTYVEKLGIQEIIVGYSHKFGKNGQGDQGLLKKLSEQYGFATHIVQPILLEGSPVNSSNIRSLLSVGEISAAERMLGYPYSIAGIVVRGNGRGNQLCFPTANLETHDPHVQIPKRGVYAVRVCLEEKKLNGVMNIGTRPTFGAGREHCEVHILDFDRDLYNQSIQVEFVARIRDEKQFSSIDALKDQISNDVFTTANMLKA